MHRQNYILTIILGRASPTEWMSTLLRSPTRYHLHCPFSRGGKSWWLISVFEVVFGMLGNLKWQCQYVLCICDVPRFIFWTLYPHRLLSKTRGKNPEFSHFAIDCFNFSPLNTPHRNCQQEQRGDSQYCYSASGWQKISSGCRYKCFNLILC